MTSSLAVVTKRALDRLSLVSMLRRMKRADDGYVRDSNGRTRPEWLVKKGLSRAAS